LAKSRVNKWDSKGGDGSCSYNRDYHRCGKRFDLRGPFEYDINDGDKEFFGFN